MMLVMLWNKNTDISEVRYISVSAVPLSSELQQLHCMIPESDTYIRPVAYTIPKLIGYMILAIYSS